MFASAGNRHGKPSFALDRASEALAVLRSGSFDGAAALVPGCVTRP